MKVGYLDWSDKLYLTIYGPGRIVVNKEVSEEETKEPGNSVKVIPWEVVGDKYSVLWDQFFVSNWRSS